MTHKILVENLLEKFVTKLLDDAIKYFKANVFFKSFVPENDADRLFIYITLWIQGNILQYGSV